MEKFTTLRAIAAPYEPANTDTDQILPARFLKKPRKDGYGQFLFHDLRLRDDGSEIPDFILNREPFRRARILVGNRNFGCGSSREGAVYALFDAGYRAVVAPSFSDIFFANCLKNGVVPARLDDAACADLRRAITASPGLEIEVDLERQEIRAARQPVRSFVIDEFFRSMMLRGVDEVGFTLGLRGEIEAFERRYHTGNSWLAPG